MSEFYDDYEDEFGEDTFAEIEERVEKRTRRELFNFDILLGAVGVLLAVSAAFFPWYVFVNPDKFSVKEMAYGDDRILPDTWQGRDDVNVSPQAIPGRNPDTKNSLLPPDQITTASIPDNVDEPNLSQSLNSTDVGGAQPFPFDPKYRLLHVVNGRALIEDASGTYIVKVGSVLPDNSRLAALEERETGWVLITSEGTVLEN